MEPFPVEYICVPVVWLVRRQPRKVCRLRNRLPLKANTLQTALAHFVAKPKLKYREKCMERSEERLGKIAGSGLCGNER